MQETILKIGRQNPSHPVYASVDAHLCTDVSDTGGKWKKSSFRKVLIILIGHLWVAELTSRLNF
jgi:hypothetical protein